MEKPKETVVVDKAWLDEILSIVKDLQQRFDDIEYRIIETHGFVCELADKHGI